MVAWCHSPTTCRSTASPHPAQGNAHVSLGERHTYPDAIYNRVRVHRLRVRRPNHNQHHNVPPRLGGGEQGPEHLRGATGDLWRSGTGDALFVDRCVPACSFMWVIGPLLSHAWNASSQGGRKGGGGEVGLGAQAEGNARTSRWPATGQLVCVERVFARSYRT